MERQESGTRRPCAVVVGAVNVDIGGVAAAPLVARDSNPGRVHMGLGGVGRNIAHNMVLLGVDTRMITALGEDANARTIAASCAALGIDLSASITVPGAATSTYLYIAGPEGDMALAVSDMEIYSRLTPEAMEARLSLLRGAALVVADANLPGETLAWLAEHCPAPVFCDPVSTVKAEKVRPVLGKLHTLKPNRLEAESLAGVPIRDEKSLRAAADALLSTGLRRVFISLGAAGVLAADHKETRRMACLPGPAVNATGGGDAFMAGLVWATLRGDGLMGCALAGLAAASINLAGPDTINPALSEALLLEKMKNANITYLEEQ